MSIIACCGGGHTGGDDLTAVAVDPAGQSVAAVLEAAHAALALRRPIEEYNATLQQISGEELSLEGVDGSTLAADAGITGCEDAGETLVFTMKYKYIAKEILAAEGITDPTAAAACVLALPDAPTDVIRERVRLLQASGVIDLTEHLFTATRAGDSARIRLLVEGGLDVDARYPGNNSTPLMVAAAYDHPHVVTTLLDLGASVHVVDKYGHPPLVYTSVNATLDAARALLAHGAAVNETVPPPLTALGDAASKGNVALMKLLLDHGAVVNARDSAGTTPLMHAAHASNHAFDAVSLLLAWGADVNAVDENGWSALMVAAVTHAGGVTASALLDHGALIDHANDEGVTSLAMAAEGGAVDVVETLLDRGARVEVACKSGKTAVDVARQQGYRHIVKMLLTPRL